MSNTKFNSDNLLPEEKARVKIDKQLQEVGWDIVSRNEYIPQNTLAVKEALSNKNNEIDYLLFIEDKAIAVVEAKREENELGEDVAEQAERYSKNPENWYGLWFNNQIPLVYLANGNKIYFKNMLEPESEYVEVKSFDSPKQMLKKIDKTSEFGALPRLEKKGLRDCQYEAEIELEKSIKNGIKKSLAILATGSGKTYLACLASYRMLNYTNSVKRILFLVDRNNLARQTESEFSLFDRTENKMTLSNLYVINRLRKKEDIKGTIVISTIQKLFAVLTGQTITDDGEDFEDEINQNKLEKDKTVITLPNDLKLPPDYFQFIIVDECHRSIYGKWKAVLDYFKDAKILGLTATPTPEAYAYFNNNIIEEYTYEQSVVDGVNVPSRVYRIKTERTIHGGKIKQGSEIKEVVKIDSSKNDYIACADIDYSPTELDRTIINPAQIKTCIKAYRDSIYTDLYPERETKWEYIPKTLIFAKDDKHADQIVEACKEVFKEKFENDSVPDNFVKKITYSAGNSNDLIRELRTEKEFRIAVTVTLVATGTDVRPLEVVMFMSDVKSAVLYTQMKGRGCRTIGDDKLKEVTPNALSKDCFYVVDAVGVTESDKTLPKPSQSGESQKTFSLEKLIEHLAHGEYTDDNLSLLRDYLAIINKRYKNNILFVKHLNEFITNFGYAPKTLAAVITKAMAENILPPFESASETNTARRQLVSCLIGDIDARKAILELQKGYYLIDTKGEDETIYTGFSIETAKSFIETFEKYLIDNKDKIEALRIIYNSEDVAITHSMLKDLQDKLIAENRQYRPYTIWSNYKTLDTDEKVEELDTKENLNALTHLIQIVRFAYKKNQKLTSLIKGCASKFNLYCGQAQRQLSEEQKAIMKSIADYIVNEGAFSTTELNSIDTDLWRKAVKSFGIQILTIEMEKLSKFILKAA